MYPEEYYKSLIRLLNTILITVLIAITAFIINSMYISSYNSWIWEERKLELSLFLFLITAVIVFSIRRNHYKKILNEKKSIERTQLEINLELAKKQITEFQNTGIDKLNPYHYIEIPDNLKDLFIDSLRAFENYAKLSGYEVKFSFDNTEKNRIGFKFIVIHNPNNISKDEIRTDIKEFLDRIQGGEEIKDIPILINEIEHYKVLSILNAKLSTIRHNAYLEKNLNAGIEEIVREVIDKKGFSQSINIYNQHGGNNNSKQIEASQSNVNLGDNNTIEDCSINIHHSFNEKKTIIDKIDNSITLVQQDDKLSDKDKEALELQLKNIKHEIEEETKPDAARLKRYWEKIKGIGERAIFSHELSQALSWIGEKFNFAVDFFKNIPS